MCMTFNRKGVPSYIRLCYRTGRRGEHVAYSEEALRTIVDPAHERRGRGGRRRARTTHLITFAVPTGTTAEEVGRVARQLGATRHTLNPEGTSAALFWERALRDVGGVLDRAAGFGWSGVPAA